MIWIGIDAHKRVHQAVALSPDGVLAQKVIANNAIGWTELLQWASKWPERIWAVEGSGSLGRGVAQFLARRSPPPQRLHHCQRGRRHIQSLLRQATA
jgi:transposase